MTQQFEHLLSPIQIGPIELRNRVLVTGHQPHLAEQSVPGDAYIAYHRERARGGVGLQVTARHRYTYQPRTAIPDCW